MSDAQSFIWYELMTTDPAAAKTFYRKVVGWAQGAMFVLVGPRPS
jgi:uncharacterized protein